MKRLLLVLLLLSLPAVVRAQSSCDKPVLSGTTTIFVPTFPFAMKVPAGITVTAVKITVDGTQAPLSATAGTPASNGDQCFLVSVTVSGNGVHTITTQYTPSGGSELSSAPFVLNLVNPAPTNHPR